MNTVKPITRKKFSIRSRLHSFSHAFHGLKAFFAAEHNALVHLLATWLLIFLAFIFPVTRMEAVILIFCTASVWAAELFNTAIEKMMDVVSTEQNQSIKFIKDVSAAAVLITAIGALCAGCLVFVPKIAAIW